MAAKEPVRGPSDPDRSEALRQVGLSAGSDAGMERFARLAAKLLRVPLALVSLADDDDGQIIPGVVGLAEPSAGERRTALFHLFCRQVAATGTPVVVADARKDDRVRPDPAVRDLGVLAFAGMPLSAGGRTIGSLCVADTRMRRWTVAELDDLADLAATCSAELQLRLISEHALRAQHQAEEMGERTRLAWENAELLLRASQDMARTASVADVRRCLRILVSGGLRPAHVGMSLVENGRLRSVVDPDLPQENGVGGVLALDAADPAAHAVRERRLVAIADPATMARDYGTDVADAFEVLGIRSAACLPLLGPRNPLGAIVIGWEHPHEIDVQERAVLTAIASYTAQAVQRALFLQERITVAHQLQAAMLTDLPAVPGLDSAALYLPAATEDLVGGDWYDSFPVASPPGSGSAASLAVTVGDITGHDTQAATIMGQVRSMLRQAVLDHPALGPAAVVTALDRACQALPLDATGTLIHGRLDLLPPGWQFTWTNAGHPAPLLAHADGRVEHLDHSDLMLYPGLSVVPRTDQQLALPAGSVLLLHTDGLTDRPETDMDAALDHTARVLAAHRHLPLSDLLDTIVSQVVGPHPADDIALVALRPHACP